ncbi:lysophospholipid acyltransferase family protein [Pelagibacteraceae bacterium]|nr:lysophospholipid acyltransferase family protein [Pelagibacteraceae bacterium]
MNKIDFSYASKSEHNFAQRLVIKTIETLTGKKKLENLYNNYSLNPKEPQAFWSDILDEMKIKVENKSSNKMVIPRDGALMIVSNHPFGIIDGLILCSLVSKVRGDFKIMTHETLQFLPQLKQFILPVDFGSSTRKSKVLNIETTKKAREQLDNKGVIIIFPSGGVSTASKLRSDAVDDEWKLFPAKLIHLTKTNILPIYFDGKNGLLFHLFASKIKNQTLKYSSYIHETRKKIGKKIEIYPGKVIKYSEVEKYKDRQVLTDFLKDVTYGLKKNKIDKQ